MQTEKGYLVYLVLRGYTQLNFLGLAQSIKSLNNGIKPIVMAKNYHILTQFFAKDSYVHLSPEFKNIFGYDIFIDSSMEDDGVLFVSIMTNGKWCTNVGKLMDYEERDTV